MTTGLLPPPPPPVGRSLSSLSLAADNDDASAKPTLLSTPLPLALHSPLTNASMSFQGVLSPRPQPNGKRYLGGYLQHRVTKAGGWLKSWKRRYFRLREHGLVCYRHEDDATPLFVLQFQPATRLQVERGERTLSSSSSNERLNENENEKRTAKGKGKASERSHSLLFVLSQAVVEGREAETPVVLRAEHEHQFSAWVENLRVQLDAWERLSLSPSVALALALQSPSSSGHDPNEEHILTPSKTEGDELETQARVLSPFPSPSPVKGHGEPVEFSMSGLGSELLLSTSTSMSSTQISTGKDQDSRGTTSLCSTNDREKEKELDRFHADFLILKEIGEGSFSIVHRAVNRVTGSLSAVKCGRKSAALDEEVRLLRKLSHPNLLGLETVYSERENVYVVTDFMRDGDLCERLLQRQHLQEDEARSITLQVLQGLEYLHRHQIVHRDVKPENVLLHGTLVKLADFGLAKQLPTPTSMLTRSCGTLEYAAPELLCGRPYGLKSDVFSLGIVLYVLLFGAFPFSIESAAELQRRERFGDGVDVRDMSCLAPESPQWLHVSAQAQDVLLRMLCIDEYERVSATALLQHPWFHLEVPSMFAMLSLKSINEEEQRRKRSCLEQGFRELLSRGIQVTKYSQNGTASPHTTTLTIDIPRQTISWTRRSGLLHGSDQPTASSRGSSPRGRVVAISEVQEIRSGCTTIAFKGITSRNSTSKQGNAREECCLSIVSTRRTLDLVAATRGQRDMLVQGLTKMLMPRPETTTCQSAGE